MIDDTINDGKTVSGGGGAVLAGRYRIVRQLGAGGMGSVWLAEDTLLDNKPFAIKMLPSILVSNKRAYRQLKDEALVAMKLTHPNIVTLRAFEENNGNPFLVMDYIEGQTLDDYLADYDSRVERAERVEEVGSRVSRDRDGRAASPRPPFGGLPEEEVIRILKPIAAALDYAHGEGVVHRDVKPANVMIRKDGHPFILDFGIAREIQETMTRVTGKLSSGTLLYMSPEQLNGEPPKPAQDIYSFAAMAYECLKGEPPFSHGQIEFQIMNKMPEPLVCAGRTGSLPVGMNGQAVRSPSIAPSVMAGLAKKPEDRPKNCVAVLEGEGSNRVERAERVEVDGGFSRAERVERVESGGRSPLTAADGAEDVGRKDRNEYQAGGGKVLVVLVLLAMLTGAGAWWWWSFGRKGGSSDQKPSNDSLVGAANTPPSPVGNDSPYPETHAEKGRRAFDMYRRGEGRKILETFSDYDAEMVPEIAYLKGVVYRDGFSGVEKDLRKAAQMFTIAANRGYAQAQLDLAVMYAEGIGVSRDLDKFLYWTEKAAEQGVVDAAFNLGYLYFSGGSGGRVKVDYAKALKYLKIAVDAGRFAACPYLGAMYQKGYGVKADDREALKWFRMGAENGDALSENNLGYMYLKGLGTPKDPVKALEYLQKADAHGNRGAAVTLGFMYENGDGVRQDLSEARRLYLKAKENGAKEAEEALRRIDDKMRKKPEGRIQDSTPSGKSRAVGILTRRGDYSRSSHEAVDENGKIFREKSFELTQKLPIIRKNVSGRVSSGYPVAAAQLLALCGEKEFSDRRIEEIEHSPTGEYLVVTMKNQQLVKIAWEGMYKSPTEDSRRNLRRQVELVWEALRAHPKSTDVFVAVQPEIVDMVPRWGTRFKSSKPNRSR